MNVCFDAALPVIKVGVKIDCGELVIKPHFSIKSLLEPGTLELCPTFCIGTLWMVSNMCLLMLQGSLGLPPPLSFSKGYLEDAHHLVPGTD